MRHTAAEKLEIIGLVEGSDLSVRRTLRELRVNRSTFYGWYQRYLDRGEEGLVVDKPARRRHWNRIPEQVRELVVERALQIPELRVGSWPAGSPTRRSISFRSRVFTGY